MSEEPDYDCYAYNFSIPAKGTCVDCKYYKKCREFFDLEIEEEEYLTDEC